MTIVPIQNERSRYHDTEEAVYMMRLRKTRAILICIVSLFFMVGYQVYLGPDSASAGWLYPLGETTETPKYSEEHVQLKSPSDTGNRPPLIYEGGDLFLGSGKLYEGFETPWGAVWQPQLWIFGTLRSAVYTFDDGVKAPPRSGATGWTYLPTFN